MNEEELVVGPLIGHQIALNVLSDGKDSWHCIYINTREGLQRDSYYPTAKKTVIVVWSEDL